MNEFPKTIPSGESFSQEDGLSKEKMRKTIEGCIISLTEMLAVLKEAGGMEEAEGVARELLDVAEASRNQEVTSPEIINKLKFGTLAVAELLFIDEMAPYEDEDKRVGARRFRRGYGRDNPPFYGGYLQNAEGGRSDAVVIYTFFDMPTLTEDIQEMIRGSKIPRVKVWAYLGDDPERKKEPNFKMPMVVLNDVSELETAMKDKNRSLLIVSELMTEYEVSDKVNHMLAKMFQDDKCQNVVVMGLKLTEKAGVLQVFEGSNMRLRTKINSQNPLPVQEKILALLEIGVSFLSLEGASKRVDSGVKGSLPDTKSGETEDRINKALDSLAVLEKNAADRYYRRKMAAFSRNSEEEKYMQRHEDHYKSFFRVNGREADEVVLTRSGLSANDITAEAVKDILPSGSKAHIQIGWYYDNLDSIKKNFPIANKLEDSRALFVNLDSCYPDDPQEFRAEQLEMIEKFIEQAKKDEANKYVLVVDATTNLLWGEDMEIPENLILVKTFSLTKHQRGSQNYFFGGAVSWNSEGLKEKMESRLDKRGGRLMTTGIMNYPRLRRSEMINNIERIKLLEASFSKGLEEGMTDLPEEKKMKIYAYNYYVYAVFPSRFRLEKFPVLDKSIDAPGLIWDLGDLAEFGDSFGLDQTRVCFVPKDFRTGEEAIRFSFGIKETEERSFELGKKVASEWARFQKFLIEPKAVPVKEQ